jgi:hypothetical protein
MHEDADLNAAVRAGVLTPDAAGGLRSLTIDWKPTVAAAR